MNIGVGFLGGLMFHDNTVNMQYVTTASLLLTVYSRYLSSAKATINCGGTRVTPAQMSAFAKQQVSIRISLKAIYRNTQGLASLKLGMELLKHLNEEIWELLSCDMPFLICKFSLNDSFL